jgi:hypothetical protein
MTSLRPEALRHVTEQKRCFAMEAVTLKVLPHCSQVESRRLDPARRHFMEQNRAFRCCAMVVPLAGILSPHISQLLPAKTLVRGIPSPHSPVPVNLSGTQCLFWTSG